MTQPPEVIIDNLVHQWRTATKLIEEGRAAEKAARKKIARGQDWQQDILAAFAQEELQIPATILKDLAE